MMKTLFMKKTIIILFLTIISFSCGRFNQDLKTGPFVLVIHGGAGGSWNLSDEEREEYMAVLSHVLEAGDGILRSGGTSLDAVETAVRMMEDSPLFNAGKGAVFTEAGKNELDASIMDGSTHEAGAVK